MQKTKSCLKLQIRRGNVMIIKFKIDDYYETCDEYERVFELDNTIDVVDEETLKSVLDD